MTRRSDKRKAAATGLQVSLKGCSTKRKADKEAVAGHQLGDPVKEKKAAAVETRVGGCSEEEDTAAVAAGGGKGEEAPAPAPLIYAVDYIVAHKRLPQREIDFILMEKRTHTPFADTLEFKLLTSDPSTTKEHLAAAAAQHDAQQERSIKFQEWVRKEFMTHGEVVVDDDYIARRVEIEEYSELMWEKAFAGIDLSNFADTDDESDDFEPMERSKRC